MAANTGPENNICRSLIESSEFFIKKSCVGVGQRLNFNKWITLIVFLYTFPRSSSVPTKGFGNLNKTPGNQGKKNAMMMMRRRSRETEKKVKKEKYKQQQQQPQTKGRDVWSLMLLHLETMPYKECHSCTNSKKHRFLNSSFTTQVRILLCTNYYYYYYGHS